MLPPVRRHLAALVAAAPPAPKSKPLPPKAALAAVDTFTAAPAAPASGFERDFRAALGKLALDKPGSTVVAQRLRQDVAGALLKPGLSAPERQQRVLEALTAMLGAGRGPAFQAITEFLQAAKQLGVPLSDETREAVRGALAQLQEACTNAANDELEQLTAHGALDPAAVRDVAQLGWILNRGTEDQRAAATLRVLGLPDGTPLGAEAAKVRAVIFDGASRSSSFSKEEQAAARALLAEWPHASPARRMELQAANGALLNKLERALGGMMAGASPQYLAEQAAQGNPLPRWIGDARSTMLTDDLAILEASRRVSEALGKGAAQ